jgi:hypothetical protein
VVARSPAEVAAVSVKLDNSSDGWQGPIFGMVLIASGTDPVVRAIAYSANGGQTLLISTRVADDFEIER